MIWEKTDFNPEEVREVARRFGLDLISATIMVRRDYARLPAARFILENDPLLLHNPFLFEDMDRAVSRIRRAVERDEPIQIYGDRDVDGITSTILMLEVLKRLGARVSWQIPAGEDDYGLTREVIESFAAAGCRLLITVDCGISNNQEIALAAGLGIDTIVLDHHNPPEVLPQAVAIIDPKRRDTAYPFRDLAGCGVVVKLAVALAFAETPLYGQPLWFLHIQPGNETWTLAAVKLVNLVEVERIRDSLPAGAGGLEKTRVYRKLAGQRVLVFDSSTQIGFLKRLLPDAALDLVDLQPEIDAFFPELAGKSLLRIRESNAAGCCEPGGEEIDALLALFTAMSWRRLDLAAILERVLDLAALGTIADMMPLVDENKIIVKRGLELITRMGRPGLRELLIRQNLHGRRLTAKDVSWQIAPVLNSAGRMGEPQRAAELFIEENPQQIEGVIDTVLELNRRRKVLGDRTWEGCFPQARSSLERTDGKFVFVSGQEIPRGITGILAARLVGFFKVPALVVSLGEVKAVGSLRSPYPADGFLDLFDDFLQNYGGHDRAAGFSLAAEKFAPFEERFFKVMGAYTPPDRQEAKIRVDAEVPPPYLNPDLIGVVERFEPYGEGCPPLVFLTRGMRIERLEVVGKTEPAHLKMLLAADRHKWPALYWNAAGREGKDFKLGDSVDIVFRLNRNYFLNSETLQLTILDLKK